MANRNLFTVNILFIYFTLTLSLNGQVHQTVSKFKETDFYTFFNFKLQKQNGNQEIYKPGAFQEFLELQVFQNQGKIDEMVLTINQEFIDKQRLLAADILKSFILLHVGENHKDFQNIFEVLSSKGDYQKHYGYYLDQILSVFLSYDGLFVIPFKEQNFSLILQNKNFKLIATFQKNINPKPIENPNYSFIDSKSITKFNEKWDLNLQLKNHTPKNEKTWIDDNPKKYQQITHIQYHFTDNNNALNYFIENFEEFSEKGRVYDPFYKKEKKILGDYVLASELKYPELNSEVYILFFVRDKICHKLLLVSDQFNLVDLTELALTIKK